MGFIMVYITNPDMETAERVVEHLVSNRIAACGNIFPVMSYYRWNGKIEKNNEVIAIVKTRAGSWSVVKREVKKIHPYEIPCIAKIDAEASEDYEQWICRETDA
jgi:periplasmic divalent cation tolerance protein